MPSTPGLALRTGCGLLAIACGAYAQDLQDFAVIRHTAEAFVQAQTRDLPGRVEATVGASDSRARLHHCEKLQAFLAPGVKLWGNSNVGVRCLGPEPWSVYLPVTVRVFADVVVLARPVPRDHPLAPSDLRQQSMDLTQLPVGVLTDPTPLIGRSTLTALPVGHVLRVEQVRVPAAITYGQTVRIIFQGDGFRVSSEGRALGNAAVGERLQVRAASGKVLKGTVQAPGVVEVR